MKGLLTLGTQSVDEQERDDPRGPEVHVNTMWPAIPMRRTAVAAVLGGRQALRPSPALRGPHHLPGMGLAEFLPLCMAAGCSPKNG